MKYNFLLIKIILLIYFLVNIFTNIVWASNNVFIVMKVNNEIITNININEEYRYLIALNADLKSLKKEEIFKLAKNSFLKEKIKKIILINKKLYFIYFKFGPVVVPKGFNVIEKNIFSEGFRSLSA